MSSQEILNRLNETLASRRNASPETSYTARLFSKGPDAILKKIGEECAELIISGKAGTKPEIIYESADVIYHTMVLLAFYGIDIEEVLGELKRREGVSGIDEKNSRSSAK